MAALADEELAFATKQAITLISADLDKEMSIVTSTGRQKKQSQTLPWNQISSWMGRWSSLDKGAFCPEKEGESNPPCHEPSAELASCKGPRQNHVICSFHAAILSIYICKVICLQLIITCKQRYRRRTLHRHPGQCRTWSQNLALHSLLCNIYLRQQAERRTLDERDNRHSCHHSCRHSLQMQLTSR